MNASRTMNPSTPRRVLAFARFFKRYMHAATLLAAALPVPVTALKFIPAYAANTGFLAVYTSLACFLLLAFVFYSRHTLARWMFPPPGRRRPPRARLLIQVLPFCLIVACAALIATYHSLLHRSVTEAMADWVRRGVAVGSTAAVLEQTDYLDVPYALGLVLSYMGIFVTAEAAFLLMAIREYLQDLLGLSEAELIADKSAAKP